MKVTHFYIHVCVTQVSEIHEITHMFRSTLKLLCSVRPQTHTTSWKVNKTNKEWRNIQAS